MNHGTGIFHYSRGKSSARSKLSPGTILVLTRREINAMVLRAWTGGCGTARARARMLNNIKVWMPLISPLLSDPPGHYVCLFLQRIYTSRKDEMPLARNHRIFPLYMGNKPAPIYFSDAYYIKLFHLCFKERSSILFYNSHPNNTLIPGSTVKL